MGETLTVAAVERSVRLKADKEVADISQAGLVLRCTWRDVDDA